MTSAVQTTRTFLPSPLKLGCSEPKSGFSGLTGHTILPAKLTTTSNAAPQALHTKRRFGVDVGDVAKESSPMKIVIQQPFGNESMSEIHAWQRQRRGTALGLFALTVSLRCFPMKGNESRSASFRAY
jgi:hypothetical protein